MRALEFALEAGEIEPKDPVINDILEDLGMKSKLSRGATKYQHKMVKKDANDIVDEFYKDQTVQNNVPDANNIEFMQHVNDELKKVRNSWLLGTNLIDNARVRNSNVLKSDFVKTYADVTGTIPRMTGNPNELRDHVGLAAADVSKPEYTALKKLVSDLYSAIINEATQYVNEKQLDPYADGARRRKSKRKMDGGLTKKQMLALRMSIPRAAKSKKPRNRAAPAPARSLKNKSRRRM